MKVLVTGAAGFIGCEVALRLLARGDAVVGVDNIGTYYDPQLKESRLQRLLPSPRFQLERVDIANAAALAEVFHRHPVSRVVHLAAQPGVRHSLVDPNAYVQSNLVGFANVLEQCRHKSIEHLLYASSSSVYGANTKLPYSVDDNVDHPLNLYAATKKANELMAHSYSHLFGLPTTGLRFFTVYGPWGRPDMAPLKFTKALFAGEPIDVYGHGKMRRDFTYIDDIVEGVVRTLDRPPQADARFDGENPHPGRSAAPYRIYNIGNSSPVDLLKFIDLLEQTVGKKAVKNFTAIQPGEVQATYADVTDLSRDTGFAPNTPLEAGVQEMVKWYRDFYKA